MNACLSINQKLWPIVEAEKTAVIANVYFPQFIWLTTGMKATLKQEYAQCLKGRVVTFFPDLGAYKDWEKKADELSKLCTVSISSLLESKADRKEKEMGLDLAYYIF